MSGTSTNVRMTPGAYLALKQLAENSGISMGTLAGFFIILSFNQQKMIESFSKDIQLAIAADVLTALGDIFRAIGISSLQDTTIAELYQSLLNPEGKKE